MAEPVFLVPLDKLVRFKESGLIQGEFHWGCFLDGAIGYETSESAARSAAVAHLAEVHGIVSGETEPRVADDAWFEEVRCTAPDMSAEEWAKFDETLAECRPVSGETETEWAVSVYNPDERRWVEIQKLTEEGARAACYHHARSRVVRRTVVRSEWEQVEG